ncbi:MAG: YfbK domain-containing protein, partial [Acidobacteriota bacterium]
NRPLELGERPRLLRPRPTDLGAGETLVFLHQLAPTEPPAPDSVSLGTVELRYRDPSTRKRHRVVVPIPPAHETFAQASSDFRLSAAAGGFGLLLARSLHAIGLDWALVESIALPREASENSPSRSELLDLIRRARSFDGHVVDEAEE